MSKFKDLSSLWLVLPISMKQTHYAFIAAEVERSSKQKRRSYSQEDCSPVHVWNKILIRKSLKSPTCVLWH